MSNAFVAADVATIIQGRTGRAGRTHTLAVPEYGRHIVAGVPPRDEEVGGLPVFRTFAETVSATGALASIAIVPPLGVLSAIIDAIDPSPGRPGVMAKSGTLSYEVCRRLVERGLGRACGSASAATP